MATTTLPPSTGRTRDVRAEYSRKTAHAIKLGYGSYWAYRKARWGDDRAAKRRAAKTPPPKAEAA